MKKVSPVGEISLYLHAQFVKIRKDRMGAFKRPTLKEKFMNHNLDRSVSWHTREGAHDAHLYEAGYYPTTVRGVQKDCFRLVFVTDDGDLCVEYRAQKRYPKDDKLQARLIKDLERWLGAEFLAAHPQLTIEDLIGLPARITIKHRHYRNHKKPFSTITKIAAARKAFLKNQPPTSATPVTAFAA